MKNKINEFFQTITPEILAPEDYTNWEEINRKTKKLRREIALLQSLDKDNPLEDLTDLLQRFPKILSVLQLLIAHTPSKIFFDEKEKYIDFREDIKKIKTDPERAKEIAKIFEEMGLFSFLQNVNSLEDVIKGVLLGLEPNVRKNRRGQKLEKVIGNLLTKVIKKINRQYNLNLSFESQTYIDLKQERKKLDYVILQKDIPQIGIEVNFYSTSGSKPSEILGRAYPEVQENLKQHGIGFIVITDGRGWEKMKPVISTAYQKISFLMNIKQAQNGYLEKAILEILNSS